MSKNPFVNVRVLKAHNARGGFQKVGAEYPCHPKKARLLELLKKVVILHDEDSIPVQFTVNTAPPPEKPAEKRRPGRPRKKSVATAPTAKPINKAPVSKQDEPDKPAESNSPENDDNAGE